MSERSKMPIVFPAPSPGNPQRAEVPRAGRKFDFLHSGCEAANFDRIA